MKRQHLGRIMALAAAVGFAGWAAGAEIGREVGVERHLADGDEARIPRQRLLEHGRALFQAVWTDQEGGGRPLTKGVGSPLSDPSDPLVFPRNFNRLSAPDANSCGGCHNVPRAGGGGDIVANVFVLAQRFDFATFDHLDAQPTRGAMDENGQPVVMDTVANSRNTLGMFGSGYIEMLARVMTADLQALRDGVPPGGSARLTARGVAFGTLARNPDGSWDATAVEGLGAASVASGGPGQPPSLIIQPFHQAGAVVSLRQFTNNAFNHHHGIQTTERFGAGLDPDGDGFSDEMTRADVTAVTLWQAQLPVPGRVIPRDRDVERAVLRGETAFAEIGCTGCHVPSLPLAQGEWVFSEPNPFNPAGNLQVGDAPEVRLDLSDRSLDQPRLDVVDGVVHVPAYTDLKLHDITDGPDDPNRESLDMHRAPGSTEFFAGNGRFLTRKLWGAANEPPYFHHGKYTTLRQAVEAHHGEAESSHQRWAALSDHDRDCVIEFLKTLQVLPEGTRHLTVDERGRPRTWPPHAAHDEADGDDDDDDDSDGHGNGNGHGANRPR